MKKKLKIFLIIFVIVAILVLLGVLSSMADKIKFSESTTAGNTPGNMNNGGYFCEADGKVYFANPYDNGTLYCMNPDETEIEKLLAVKVKYICADENYLYYYQLSSSGQSGLGYVISTYGIYRTTFNMKKKACLTNDVVFDMQLLKNHIYYSTVADGTPQFRKVKIDVSENKLLDFQPTNPACAANGVIYYSGTESNHYLYQLNPDTNASSVVWEGNIWDPVYDNGYIYYMDVENNYRLCRYSLSAGEVEILTHDRIDCYNVGGGYIYYQSNSSSLPALKKMNTDGTNVEIVSEGNYTDINMTSRYVYFRLFGTESPVYRVPLGSAAVSTFDAARTAAMEALNKAK